jgi:hypothetical protein
LFCKLILKCQEVIKNLIFNKDSLLSKKVFVQEKKSATEKVRAKETFLMKLNTKPLNFIKMQAG